MRLRAQIINWRRLVDSSAPHYLRTFFSLRWRGVREHGFKALGALNNDADAAAAFKAMDDNGGGVVLMDEWCEWLKAAEIKAGTLLGATLAADEGVHFEVREVPPVVKKRPKKPTKARGPSKAAAKLKGGIKTIMAVNAFGAAGAKKGGLFGAAKAATAPSAPGPAFAGLGASVAKADGPPPPPMSEGEGKGGIESPALLLPPAEAGGGGSGPI